MGANELRNLVESLMSNTSKTEEGISCPFCMIPQKQIISHIKKTHHTEMQENCRTENYEPELKKYLQKIKDQKKIKKMKKADPDFYAKRQQKYRMQQLLMNPTEFKRKRNTQKKECLARLSHLGKAKLAEYKKKWAKLNATRNKTFEASKKRFLQEIMYGPVFPCVCCNDLYFCHQVVPYDDKLQDKIRSQAKAAEMRNQKGKATDQDLLTQMKKVSILEEEEQEKWDEEEEKEKMKKEERERKEEEKKTERHQTEQDNQRIFEGAELEEEHDKVMNAFKLWMERTDNIINTLADCCEKALLPEQDAYHALLVRCGGMICSARNEAEAIWRLLADNMDNMETWTFEQMAYAKMLAERRDMHKTGQEYLHKLAQKILALLEDQQISQSQKRTLFGLMMQKWADKVLETFGDKCTCKVKLILVQ